MVVVVVVVERETLSERAGVEPWWQRRCPSNVPSDIKPEGHHLSLLEHERVLSYGRGEGGACNTGEHPCPRASAGMGVR